VEGRLYGRGSERVALGQEKREIPVLMLIGEKKKSLSGNKTWGDTTIGRDIRPRGKNFLTLCCVVFISLSKRAPNSKGVPEVYTPCGS